MDHLSRTEAAAALQEIDSAGVKSRQLYSYRISSATLLLWGVLWILMGVITELPAQDVSRLSPILWGTGLVVTFWIGYRRHRAAQEEDLRLGRRQTIRQISLAAVCVTFLVVSDLLLQPTSAAQGFAYGALFAGALCVGFGLWQGVRYMVVGIAVAAVALSIYWLRLPHGAALISLAGGTALIASGFWMRQE